MISASLFTAFALMTAAAALAVLWPLGRTRALKGAREADLAVYRDQLAEIGRDRESGRLPPEQAEAARIEVARRMLAADAMREAGAGAATGAPTGAATAASPATTAATTAATWRRRVAAIAALVLIPAGAAGLYGLLGSPDVPGAPLAERLAAPPDRGDVAILVRRVEDHLAANPNDGNGYEILAPVYLRLGRPQDAARAFGEAIRILGPTAERLSARGEALMAAADGLVSAEAQRAFAAALALDPKEPRALFFTGVAAEQDGRPAEAAAIFRRMIAEAPRQAPYLPMVQAALARAEAEAGAGAAPATPAPGPSAADVQAAAALSADDRTAMVRGMVDRLEARLAADPNDLDGWLRLARAFDVLGQKDKALGAINAARAAFKDNQEALGRIDAAEKDLARGG